MFRRMLAVLALTAAALATPAAAHADTTYRGEGDDVVRIHATKKPGLIRFTHDGESNFIVHAVDPHGRAGEYLVNEIGPYTGTVLYNDYGTRGTSGLEIKADGYWTATFLPLAKARCWCSATIRGTGDQVLKLSPTRGLHTVRAAHNGEANFIVHANIRIGSYGDLLFNQIGRYRGKALLPVGTRLVTVHADGAWTLTRS
ncbi:hypothetical protein [Microbispora sp. H13382]|uniref:hypothetical protein n=1 Tax=Microbispora sp. H13382 TaxID=2729112 RepID=UPI0016045439|nr:hypothetical protein [Microbispora sp. H13382]